MSSSLLFKTPRVEKREGRIYLRYICNGNNHGGTRNKSENNLRKIRLLCRISKQAGEAGKGGGEVAWWEKKRWIRQRRQLRRWLEIWSLRAKKFRKYIRPGIKLWIREIPFMYLQNIISLNVISTEYHNMGCFKIGSGPPIPSLEGTDPILTGNHVSRLDAVQKCLHAARRKGNKMFAVASGGKCLSAAVEYSDVEKSYTETSHGCKNGKGATNYMNIYIVKGMWG